MADKASNVVLNFKMDGQIEYAKTIRDINAIMNAAASEYKTHVAAMGKDADATQKLAAEKKKLEIQLEAGRERTEKLRTEYQAMAKDTKTSAAQLADKYKKLQNSERAEIALSNALDRVNDGLSEQAVESRKAEQALNKLESEAEGLETQTEKLNAEYKLQVSQLGENASESDKLKLKMEHLNNTHELSQKKVKNYEDQLEQAKKQYGENSTEVDKYEIQLIEARTAEQLLANEIQATNKKLKEQEDVLANTSKKLKETGDKMKDVGKDMSMKVTAPIVGLGAMATKSAIDFESSFAGVRKTVDATEEQFADLEQGIRDMSKELPASASEIAGVAESAGQLGIETDNVLGFTETIIDLGESTNLSLDQAATEFSRFANITKMSQDDFDRLGSSVVSLGNDMATTESEIVEMGMRLAAQGKQVGMSEAEIMALAATMSSLGIEAEAGGTAMTTVMKKIDSAVGEGGKSLEGFADAAGISSKDFATLWENEPVKALDTFVQSLGESGAEGENLSEILADLGIKGIRESDSILRMAGASDLLADAVDNSSTAWQENSALSAEAEERYKTTEAQLSMLKNQFTDIAIDIGEILIPMILSLIEFIQPWIERFSELDESTQKVIVVIAGLVAAIGPLLVIIGTLITSAGAVVGAIGAISAPVWIVIGAITALIAIGVALWKNWDTIKEKSISIWTSVAEWFVEIWQLIKNIFNSALDWIDAKTGGKFKSVTNVIRKYMSMAEKNIARIWEFIKNTFDNATKFIKSLVTLDFQGMKDAISDQMNNTKETITDIWDNVMGFFEDIDLLQIGKDIIQGLIDGITSKVRAVTDAVKSVTDAITGKVKSILNIQSPSRVMMELGRYITEGLGIGIDEMGDFAVNKTENVARNITGTMKDGIELPEMEMGTVVRQPASFTSKQQTYDSGMVASLGNIGSNIKESLKGISGNISVNVFLDTKQLNTELAPGMSVELNSMNKMNARSQGVITL